jgi:MoaA/NifB/PqqE/SkfB family radical SAM enzyme
MSLTESLLRAAWPAMMATRQGRLLPGRLAPRLGPGFLAAVKKVNQEHLQRAEAHGDSTFRAYPGFITVAGTSRCNIRCEFCINQWDAKPDGSNRPHMKPEHVHRIVHEVFPYIRKLALSVSGEPLYDPHFQELLDAAREYGVFVEFTTNAMLVSKPGMLERILDGVGRVNISMDGATPATFERLRGGAKFEKVCENVRLLTAGRAGRGQRTPEYNIRYILMRDTIDELPLMVDLARDLGVDHLYTNHLQVFMQELQDQSLVMHKARANRAFAAARERAAARNQVVVLPPDFDLADDDTPAHAAATAAPGPATAAAVAPGTATPSATTASATTASVAELPGEAWAGTGAIPRAAARPAELPPSAYLGRCPYLWDQAFFEADGSVFPCCNSGGVALGHLDKAQDFWAIWTSAAYDRMRANVYSPQCHDICVNCYLREGTVANEAYVRPVEGAAATGGWSRRKARR